MVSRLMTVQDASQYQVQHQATLLVKGINNQMMDTTASLLQSACIQSIKRIQFFGNAPILHLPTCLMRLFTSKEVLYFIIMDGKISEA